MISLITSHWKHSKFSFHESLAVRKMRKQRERAEVIFSDEEILREAALSAEDPTWDGSVPLGRLKSFLGRKVCELFKGEVCSCIGTFFLHTHSGGCGGGGGGSCCVCDDIFSQPCHKFVICTQSSASDSRLQTLKWWIWPHKARLPLCLTTFYVISPPFISDSCRCTITSPPCEGVMMVPQCMNVCSKWQCCEEEMGGEWEEKEFRGGRREKV